MTWLQHLLGLDNASGQPYLLWSGVGSDLGELAIVGGLVSMIRRHNCHVKPCWRVGRHQVEGTSWTVCARHHPTGAPSAADVEEAGQ